MAEQISVVIIDADEESRQSTKILLKEMQQVKIVAEAIDLSRGYDSVKANQPTIVILDLFPTVDHALKLAARITQNFPQTTLFVASSQTIPEVIIRAMRAGAREFLAKPFNKDELVNAVNSVIRWQCQKMAEGGSGGKMLAIFGVKGGVGTTTIATNLAVNLAEHSKKSVILVDLNLQFGNAALFLNIRPEYTILDVANHLKDLDSNLLKSVLPKHSSGVWLLAGPNRVEEAEAITATHLEQILKLLRSVFGYIISDTNDVLDELTLKALDESNLILTVFTRDLPAIYNARRCLDVFQHMGYDHDKVLLIMNRYASNNGIAGEELEKSINYPVFWRVPNHDYAKVVSSINQGIPIAIMTPRSKISLSFNKLAEHLNGGVSNEQEEIKRNLKGQFIKKLFFR